MMAPDQVSTIFSPKIAAWSSKVRGGSTMQPVSEKKIGMLYSDAFIWRKT
jgi:hypothetical protein